MYVSLGSLVSSADDLLALEVEEVAAVLLAHLNGYDASARPGGAFNQYNFFLDLERSKEYGSRQPQVVRAFMEAWAWLQAEGFLVFVPDMGGHTFFLSRRAQKLKTREAFAGYRKASLLPKGQVHEVIAAKVYPAFLRGEYDTAVFQAFREVEIAVREAGSFGSDDVGVELMRSAFRPANRPDKPVVQPGPLADQSLPVAEQEAMAHLFAGAIGVYKNPQSHRYVPTEAVDAAEVILFASHLLRIVDRLSPVSPSSESA